MAGEWTPIDCNLATKPEVLELVDETGDPADAVIGRLVQLWLWAAMNSEDGTARMTVRRLGKLFGGSDTFWAGVQRVGWLDVDAEAGTVAIPGWERRFSQATKARLLQAVRSRAYEERNPGRKHDPPASDGAASEGPTPDRRRRELGDKKFSSPREAWQEILRAWAAAGSSLKPWKLDRPPKGGDELLADPAWCGEALAAIAKLPSCRFFKTPPTMIQLFAAGFVDKVLGGSFDQAKGEQRGGRDFGDAPPPPRVWTGEAAEALERTRRKLAAAKEGL